MPMALLIPLGHLSLPVVVVGFFRRAAAAAAKRSFATRIRQFFEFRVDWLLGLCQYSQQIFGFVGNPEFKNKI
jgi:hypothetical protein